MFNPLLLEEVKQIVAIQLKNLILTLEKNNISLKFTPLVVDYIANQGFDVLFGARPLKRLIQQQILYELSKMILSGQIEKESAIEIDVENKILVFRNISK